MEKIIERLSKTKEKLEKDIKLLEKNLDSQPLVEKMYNKTKLELDSINKILKQLFEKYSKRNMRKLGYE